LLIVEKILLLGKQTQVHDEKKRVGQAKRWHKNHTKRKTKCCQKPLLAICRRPMPNCVRKLRMYVE